MYTQDPNLNKFFKQYEVFMKSTAPSAASEPNQENSNTPSISASDIYEALQALPKSQIHCIVQFFPIIMKQIFRILTNQATTINIAEECFLSLISIIDAVFASVTSSASKSTGYPFLLESYLNYAMDVDTSSTKPLYEEIVKLWINIIEQKNSKTDETFKHSSTLFGIIIKSMTVKIHSSGDLYSSSQNRSNRFSKSHLLLLKKLLDLLNAHVREKSVSTYNVAKLLNTNVALFFKDCLSILDRGIAFRLIYDYSRSLDLQNKNSVLVGFKFTFLRVINDHEHYIPLNLPIVDRQEKITDPANMKIESWQRHFLAGLLLTEIETTLLKNQNEPEIRIKGIESLLSILIKHDHDSRYATKSVREHVVSIYLPYIPFIIENLATISKATNYERKMWLSCFIFILKGLQYIYSF